jgi:hypothetical protein
MLLPRKGRPHTVKEEEITRRIRQLERQEDPCATCGHPSMLHLDAPDLGGTACADQDGASGETLSVCPCQGFVEPQSGSVSS